MAASEQDQNDRPVDSPTEPAATEPTVSGVVVGEADASGATIVAAVGDESGVQAVAAIDTDYFNTVLVADFADPEAATAAYMTLLEASASGALHIDGVLTAGTDYPTYCEDIAHSAVFSEYLGLQPRYTYTVDIGTPVFAKAVDIAASAIAWPGRKLATGIGNHRMIPLSTITTTPVSTSQ